MEKFNSDFFFDDVILGIPIINLIDCFGEIMNILKFIKTSNTFECIESNYFKNL